MNDLRPTPSEADLIRARRVLGLYRGAAGGERVAARGALLRLLDHTGLTLADLEPGLPPTQNPDDLDGWREEQGWLAQLGTDGQDEALERLVDSPQLTPAERERVLGELSLAALVGARAQGWLYAAQDSELTEADLLAAARTITPAELLPLPGSLAEGVQRLTLARAWELARPERRLRARDELHAEFVAGLVETLPGRRGRVLYPGAGETELWVVARLSVNELSRIRTLMAQGEERLARELRRAAREAGRSARLNE